MVVELPRSSGAMDCAEVLQYVDLYLDDEFSPDDRVLFESHISRCDDCCAHVDAERRFRTTVRSIVPPVRAPAGLRMRIEDALEAEIAPKTTPLTHALRWAPVFGVAAALAIVLMLPNADGSDRTGDAPSVVAAGATPVAPTRVPVKGVRMVSHTQELSSISRMTPDVTGDSTTIRRYVQSRMAVDGLPLPEQDGLRLRGAREVTFAGAPAVLYIYVAKAGRIGVIRAPHLETPASTPELDIERRDGLTVGTFAASGERFVVVSELDVSELRPLLR